MNEIGPKVGMGIAIIASLVAHFVISRRRRLCDYRKDIEPVLRARGLTLVGTRCADWFTVGPFPKIEVQWGRPQSEVMGFCGEYSQYRIVACQDSSGSNYELWAKLEFELFRLRRIRWRAEKGQAVPSQVQDIMEG